MQSEDLLQRRRDRLIATLLGIKDRELDRYLPADVSAKFRKALLDGVNDFADLCLDLVRSLDDGITNELWLQKLDEIYNRVVIDGGSG